MQRKNIVEKLLWHDCPVDGIKFDARAQILKLYLDPSEEMLEALGMAYSQTKGFRVVFTDVEGLMTSYSFMFFEVHEKIWGEVLHADFAKRNSRSICNLGAMFYRGVVQAGYGEATFEYDHASVEKVTNE